MPGVVILWIRVISDCPKFTLWGDRSSNAKRVSWTLD
jgi:hypothetical protein